MNLPIGCGLSIYKYLLINKIIEVNMLNAIDVNNVIPIITVNNEQIKKVELIC